MASLVVHELLLTAVNTLGLFHRHSDANRSWLRHVAVASWSSISFAIPTTITTTSPTTAITTADISSTSTTSPFSILAQTSFIILVHSTATAAYKRKRITLSPDFLLWWFGHADVQNACLSGHAQKQGVQNARLSGHDLILTWFRAQMRTALLKHVNDYHQLEYVVKFKRDKDSPDRDLYDENDVVHIPLPDCPSYDDSLPVPPDPSRRHSFAEAVVQACQSMEASEDEKSKNEWIIGKLQIESIALIEDNESTQKAEYNAFTDAVNIQRMAGKRFTCHPIVPAKRKLRKSSSDEILATSFAHLIHPSPLRDILVQRQYFEVNHQVCQMLNSDWNTHLISNI
ncbi:hypothetical protein BDB00DRAFT_887596 [Zychaea mexicana]|uniref:uncharacterized protein n=1 Tax=Zychaea mexicana TaxID=64656 RepID=UPI0022FF1283|nr:uncharacterized protein BDB00DRAFT_887596 [Zychaea mexicana]KAI9488548.1 hypothetical protein BDB00DRAFT_887596 [Zychaea mexicana]